MHQQLTPLDIPRARASGAGPAQRTPGTCGPGTALSARTPAGSAGPRNGARGSRAGPAGGSAAPEAPGEAGGPAASPLRSAGAGAGGSGPDRPQSRSPAPTPFTTPALPGPALLTGGSGLPAAPEPSRRSAGPRHLTARKRGRRKGPAPAPPTAAAPPTGPGGPRAATPARREPSSAPVPAQPRPHGRSLPRAPPGRTGRAAPPRRDPRLCGRGQLGCPERCGPRPNGGLGDCEKFVGNARPQQEGRTEKEGRTEREGRKFEGNKLLTYECRVLRI